MIAECNLEVENVNWAQLSQFQNKLVHLVEQLPEGPLLLTREYQSQVHLSQLARDQPALTSATDRWKQLLERMKVKRCWVEYNRCQEKLKNGKKKFDEGKNPDLEEIQEFIWLM